MSAETSSRPPYGLIFSIVLNGLLIGLLAGVFLSSGGKKKAEPDAAVRLGGIDRGVGRAIIMAAPAEDREAIRTRMRKGWERAAADRAIVREAQTVIAREVGSANFDKAAIDDAFANWREADLRVKKATQDALAEALNDLSPEARARVSKIMTEHGSGREGRRGRFRERMKNRRPN